MVLSVRPARGPPATQQLDVELQGLAATSGENPASRQLFPWIRLVQYRRFAIAVDHLVEHDSLFIICDQKPSVRNADLPEGIAPFSGLAGGRGGAKKDQEIAETAWQA